jgi:hypothetical protein
MKIDMNSIVTHAPDAVSRLVDGQMVIVLPSKGEVKVLNEVGACIWELVDGRSKLGEIVDKVVAAYNVEVAQAEADMLQFIEELITKQMLIAG